MLKTTTSYMLLVLALLAILPFSAAVTTAQYCGNSLAGGHTAINRLWQSPPNIPAIVLEAS